MEKQRSKKPRLVWFDGHLDLAYLAQTGRDMTRRVEDLDASGPIAVTLPALREGGISAALATIFVQQRGTSKDDADGPWCFSSADEAHECCRRQLAIYAQWRQAGLIEVADAALPPASRGLCEAPLRVVLLLEGAAGIRTLDDLDVFYSAGVRVIALSWVNGTIWAGGDQSGGGLTVAGRALVARIDALNMVHDLSHLSEQAFWDMMATATRPMIASHSNCRALLPGKQHPERHLSDEQIRAIANRGGMIGINLFSKFLVTSGRATIADVVRHVQHMVQLAGRTDFIGLGSDMDGGFGADELPRDLNHPRHLDRLADALAIAGFSTSEVRGFAHDNWTRFLNRHSGF